MSDETAIGTHWDWNGLFWMMGENPLFLIDLEYHNTCQTVPDPGNPEADIHLDYTAGDSCRCYFIPDAHHAIPFIYLGEETPGEDTDPATGHKIPGKGKYEAPPWFDAVMKPSDAVDTAGRPLEFYVWLNRKSIKYTITPYYEDVWDEFGVSVHVPSKADWTGGLGIPYYGLVTQIEDRYGNRMEIEYCADRRFSWDDFGNDHPEHQTPDCMECGQNCSEKGQIRRVRLVSAEDVVVWTLVYTHRAFDAPHTADDYTSFYINFPNGEPAGAYGQHALHSIHVYEGDVDPQADCLTLDADEFCSAASIAEMEALNHSAIDNHTNWVLEVKYTYGMTYCKGTGTDIQVEDGCLASGEETVCSSALLYATAGPFTAYPGYPNYPIPDNELKYRLLKTNVTRRDPAEASGGDSQVTMYRYGWADAWADMPTNGRRYLKAIYDNDTINSILAAQGDEGNPDVLFDIADCEMVSRVIDPVTGETESKMLATLASWRSIQHADDQGYCSCSPIPDDGLGLPPLPQSKLVSMVQFYGGAEETFAFEGGRRFLADNRLGSEDNGEYMLYVFLEPHIEPGTPQCDLSGCDLTDDGSLRIRGSDLVFHHPLRFKNFCATAQNPDNNLYTPDLSRRFFIAVIDQIEVAPDSGDYDPATLAGIASRRVVEMNATGFVLRDRVWDKEDLEGGPTTQTGTEETCVYDLDTGRMIERRSKGWDSPENENRETDGLIHVFEYFDDQSNAPGELSAIGVKRGAGTDTSPSTVQYVAAFERDVAGRPDLITKEVRYSIPTTDATPGSQPGMEMTESEYALAQGDYEMVDGYTTAPITEKKVITSAVPWSEDIATLYHGVDLSQFDDNGNRAWHGEGSVADPDNMTDIREFYATYTGHDDVGRPVLIVQDIDLSAPFTRNDLAGLPEALPTGWTHVAPDGSAALNLATTLEYHPIYGLTRTIHPNCRETRIAYVENTTTNTVRQWTFDDVTFDSEDPATRKFRVGKPVTIKTFVNGRLTEEKRVRLTDTDGEPDGLFTEAANQQVLSVSTPSYDSSGRLISMERTGADGASSVSASILYDGYGGIARQRDPEGTLTRTVHDALGRVFKIYRGTNDDHEFWGHSVACEDWQDPQYEDCYDPDLCEDDMVLVEKRYYGHGVNNFGLLTAARSYRDLPDNQYFEEIPTECYGENPPEDCPPENNEDLVGWVTEIGYDWRMRPVWERSEDSGGNALSHTFTWYDNLDRVRFVATYGSSAPSDTTIDPRLLGADCAIPDAAAILGGTPAPQSLTETCYNARGQEGETLSYDVASTSTLQFTATKQFFNHRNAAVETHSPNSPVQRSTYDYKGRLKRSSTYARVAAGDDIEITRTDTAFDENDRATHTTHWERRDDATGTELTAANSVKTYTQSWYDTTGRIIASANFGTNNPGGTFETGGEPASFGIGDPGEIDADTPPVEYEVGGDPASQIVGCVYNDDAVVDALLTCYSYDDAGRQVAVFHPDQTVTRTEYDGLDRVILEIENADDTDPELVQRTAYQYDSATGQLVKMAAILPNHQGGISEYDDINWTRTDGSIQVTKFVYVPGWGEDTGVGAAVVDSSGNPISSNGSFLKRVCFPEPSSGQPWPSYVPGGDQIEFTYYSDGSVASRTDARGTVFTHTYDELSRRTETQIDDSAWYDPAESESEVAPLNRIRRIGYEYDDEGRLYQVTAYSIMPSGGERVVSQNRYAYDLNSNLLADYQQHFDYVDAPSGDTHTYPPPTGTTPVTTYRWDYSPMDAHNFERLGGIRYPHETTLGTQPTLTFHYGNDADDVDSAVGRVTAIDHLRLGDDIANYDYAGMMRRVGMTHGNGTTQSATVGSTYSGLDKFGRVTDLHYKNATGDTLHRYQYGYDKAGNRTHARVTQAMHRGISHDNDRSYLYEYDNLHRLTWAGRGQLSTDNSTLLDAIPTTSAWQLDNLGNWSGGATDQDSFVYTTDSNRDGIAEVKEIHHAAQKNNTIDSVFTNGVEKDYVFDRAGNLIDDGKRYYQYDGWNRLVQVNLRGTITLDPATGRIIETPDGTPSELLGDMLCRYTYDGLGRLIRKETPVNAGSTYLQHKDLYYDGVRRIEEVIFRPTETPDGIDTKGAAFATGGDVENDELKLERADGSAPSQQVQEALGGEILPEGDTYVDREYVYGPEYVDEFVLQIDRVKNLAMYMLQDANYNVMALTAGPNFPDGQSGILPLGAMLEQYVYEPYGEVVVSETFVPHAVNRVGHQGLFFERFHGSYADKALKGKGSKPDDSGLYYNRNRFYDPTLGRFIQRDPNETALPIITALAKNGASLLVLAGAFDGQGMYGDGMNLYQYASSNPVNRRDPLGLDDFDDFLSDVQGDRIATVGYINEAAGWVLVGTQNAIGLVGGMLGITDLYNSMRSIFEGEAGFWDYLDVGLHLIPAAGPIARFGMRAGRKAFGIASKMVRHGRGRGGTMAGRLKKRFSRSQRKFVKGGCFVAGTLVLTPQGLEPIDSLAVGTCVVTMDPGSAADQPFDGMVEEEQGAEWKIVQLTAQVSGGRECLITLLRTADWLDAVGAEVGEEVQLSLVDHEMEGPACVLAIDAWRPSDATSAVQAGTVTGTFVTQDSHVLDLFVQGCDEPIGTTAGHPFWSLDRDCWVAAKSLETGERLRALNGEVTVSALRPRRDVEPVYNVEIIGVHSFLVSDRMVLAHNMCMVPALPLRDGMWRWAEEGVDFSAWVERREGRLTLWEMDIKGEVGVEKLHGVMRRLKELAKSEGFSELRIVADRVTGEFKGDRDKIYKLF